MINLSFAGCRCHRSCQATLHLSVAANQLSDSDDTDLDGVLVRPDASVTASRRMESSGYIELTGHGLHYS